MKSTESLSFYIIQIIIQNSTEHIDLPGKRQAGLFPAQQPSAGLLQKRKSTAQTRAETRRSEGFIHIISICREATPLFHLSTLSLCWNHYPLTRRDVFRYFTLS